MKIEKLNENQIRCTLSSFDLSVRNLNLGELAYGSEKARSLFREMIQKAANEVGFEAEDIPLMVEAIPLSNESVMLVITKIEDPEELDTRFSKFAPMAEGEQDGLYGGIASELLEGAEGLMEFLKNDLLGLPGSPAAGALGAQTEAGGAEPSKQAETPAVQSRIYRFDSLDHVTDAAHAVQSICDGPNALYKKPGTSSYYLVLSSEGCDPLAFSRLCNILAEYGEKVKPEAATEAYYQEHYETIIRSQALQKLAAL